MTSLALVSNKASLAEVLNELHAQLNADIPIPAGAEQELVAVVLGPGTQREVISKLLEGSRYNFIIVGTDQDANKVERVILSPKTPGGVVAARRIDGGQCSRSPDADTTATQHRRTTTSTAAGHRRRAAARRLQPAPRHDAPAGRSPGTAKLGFFQRISGSDGSEPPSPKPQVRPWHCFRSPPR